MPPGSLLARRPLPLHRGTLRRRHRPLGRAQHVPGARVRACAPRACAEAARTRRAGLWAVEWTGIGRGAQAFAFRSRSRAASSVLALAAVFHACSFRR
eukprot:5967374-Pleurochrysis_carterae.AAC.1